MAATWRGHLEIARVDHWIKNVFVLPGTVLALVYLSVPLSVELLIDFALGMLSVGLVASSNYTINELLDARTDGQHPDKQRRAVVSGRVSVPLAWAQWLGLFAAGAGLSLLVSPGLFAANAALWVMGLIYNVPPLRTKDVAVLDVLTEAVNNPIRLLAGWYIVAPTALVPSGALLASYWFVGGYFMALKRYAEYAYLVRSGASPAAYRASFAWYDERRLLTTVVFHASAAMLFFGAFLMRYRLELVLSFPLIALVMSQYLRLAMVDDSPVQAPERLYRYPGLIVSATLTALVILLLLVVDLAPLADILTPTMPTSPESGSAAVGGG